MGARQKVSACDGTCERLLAGRAWAPYPWPSVIQRMHPSVSANGAARRSGSPKGSLLRFPVTCRQCCGIGRVFDQKEARKRLKRYRKKGPDKVTTLLIEAISSHKDGDASLLDVGGGVGAVQLALLNHGVVRATSVEASLAYHAVAKEEAVRQGVTDRVTYLPGDFVDIAPQLVTHDIVTMDKVICCYPDAKELIHQAAQHSNHLVGLAYSHDNWLTRMVAAVANVLIQLRYRDFRGYIHANSLVGGILTHHGFRQVHRASTVIMQVTVWEKDRAVA